MLSKVIRVGLLSGTLLSQVAQAEEPLIFRYKNSTIMREGVRYYIETAAPPQPDVSIFTFGLHKDNCGLKDLNLKMFRIHIPPKHGIICYKPASGAALRPINDLWYKCRGAPLRGVEFIYYPHPGYAGVDYLELGYIDPKMPRNVFSVKVHIAEPYGKQAGHPQQQEQGVLQECAPLIS